MATPNIVPRADSEGGLGTSSKYWASAYIDTITTTGNINLPDGAKIVLGTGEDLQIRHDGSNSRIEASATGNLIIKHSSSDADIQFKGNDGGSAITALTLDMSDAGTATFGGGIIIEGVSDSSDGLHLKDRTYVAFSDAGSVVSRFRSSSEGVYQFQDASFNTRVEFNNSGNITATSYNGIPFFSDATNNSMYTHDVSGTDDTAQYNTAYGFAAMDAITTGDQNAAVGYGTGGALTTGSNNALLGYRAGLNLTTGHNNVAIGAVSYTHLTLQTTQCTRTMYLEQMIQRSITLLMVLLL